MFVLGLPSCTLLSALKASARNSIFLFSLTGKLRERAKFKLNRLGPRITPRAEFPYCPGPLATKAPVLNHRAEVGSSSFGSTMTLGRWLFVPVKALSRPLLTASVVPLITRVIVESCQPLAILRNQVELNVGVPTKAERFNECRRSAAQLPRSLRRL